MQFSEPLSESELVQLSQFMKSYPRVPLRVYGHYGRKSLRLDFLKFFPFLKGFQVDLFELENLDGLNFLPEDLEFLALGATKTKSFSLRVLERFGKLKELYLEGHKKDFEAVGRLTLLEQLSLRSITLPNLSSLLPLKNLESLAIKLGGTTSLDLIPEIGRLKYLELWMIKGLQDVSFIGEMSELRYLFLQDLKNVTELPSFARLAKLRRVHLEHMQGLTDFGTVSQAPGLRELALINMSHLQPEAVNPFVGHPALQRASVYMGSDKKNAAVKKILALPDVERPMTADGEPFYRTFD